MACGAVALSATILVTLPTVAQTLPQPLIEVARKAVVGNPEIQARWREFTAAGHEHEFAKSGQRPRVDLIASAGRQWTNNRPDLSTNLDYYRNGQGITLTQMLFDGFYTRNEISRLGYAKLVRYYELLESSETITLEAMRAYADVAKQFELVEAAKSNYIEHKLITQLIEERTSAGVSRGVDLEQATGRLALAESNLITEISNLHDVSARYLRVIGDRPAANVAPLPERLKLNGLPTSGAQAMGEGLPGSPTINAAYENVRSAKAQVESNKAGYYPRLDFRAGQNWSNNYAGTAGSWTDSYAELALNYNLYRGGADRAREKQAIELRYQARDLQEKACRDVRQTLAIAYNDLTRLLDQLNFLDQHRLSTEKARQAYRQQFEIGQRTLLDMLNTQNEYFEASRAYTNARYNQIMAQARTLAGMGRLTATLGVTRPDQPTASDAGQDRGELPAEELCPFELPPLMVVDKAKLVADVLPYRPRQDPPAAAPAPRPSPAPAAVVPAKSTFSADALFDFDKADIKPAGKKELDELISKIKGVDLELAIAVGHTDSVGSEAYNLALSKRRAESVKSYLVSQGIAADKIRTEGKGESQPVASNDTAEGRAKNRRVDIEVVTSGKR